MQVKKGEKYKQRGTTNVCTVIDVAKTDSDEIVLYSSTAYPSRTDQWMKQSEFLNRTTIIKTCKACHQEIKT